MNILALGAHPDDIEYGCGGMLAKYALRGHAVYMFVASDGALGGDSEVRHPSSPWQPQLGSHDPGHDDLNDREDGQEP